jgi:hypothetical protein
MSSTSGAIDRAMLTVRGALPHGQLLTPEVWAHRHRGIVWLLWLHVAGIAAFAMIRGYGLAHGLQEASLVAVFALPAAHHGVRRRARSAAAVLGLITSSAVLVHLSGGVVEMHFHFFVMIGVITLYQDWLPFGLALGYVVVHHGLLGALRQPTSTTTPRPGSTPGRGPSSMAGSCSRPASPTWSTGACALTCHKQLHQPTA